MGLEHHSSPYTRVGDSSKDEAEAELAMLQKHWRSCHATNAQEALAFMIDDGTYIFTPQNIWYFFIQVFIEHPNLNVLDVFVACGLKNNQLVSDNSICYLFLFC